MPSLPPEEGNSYSLTKSNVKSVSAFPGYLIKVNAAVAILPVGGASEEGEGISGGSGEDTVQTCSENVKML